MSDCKSDFESEVQKFHAIRALCTVCRGSCMTLPCVVHVCCVVEFKIGSHTTSFHEPDPDPADLGSLASCIITEGRKFVGCTPFRSLDEWSLAGGCQF